jgi:hypothetical protein
MKECKHGWRGTGLADTGVAWHRPCDLFPTLTRLESSQGHKRGGIKTLVGVQGWLAAMTATVRWKQASCIASGDNACAKRQVRVPSDRCVCHPLPQLCGVCYAQLRRHTPLSSWAAILLRTHATRLKKIKELGCDTIPLRL